MCCPEPVNRQKGTAHTDQKKGTQSVRRPVPTQNNHTDPDDTCPEQGRPEAFPADQSREHCEPEHPEGMSAEIRPRCLDIQDGFQVAVERIIRDIRTRMGLDKMDFHEVFEDHPGDEPDGPEKGGPDANLVLSDSPDGQQDSPRNREFGVSGPADDSEYPGHKNGNRLLEPMPCGMVEIPEKPGVDSRRKKAEQKKKKTGFRPGRPAQDSELFKPV